MTQYFEFKDEKSLKFFGRLRKSAPAPRLSGFGGQLTIARDASHSS